MSENGPAKIISDVRRRMLGGADGEAEVASLAAEDGHERAAAAGERMAASGKALRDASVRFACLTDSADKRRAQGLKALENKHYSLAKYEFESALKIWEEAEAEEPKPEKPPEDALSNVRTLAKEWLGGITALFGIFSVGGFFIAGDAIEGLDEWRPYAFMAAALLAVALTAASIGMGNKAAYGWPGKPKRTITGLRYREAQPRQAYVPKRGPDALRGAVHDLEWAAVLAGAALLALVAAVGVVWGDQLQAAPGWTGGRLLDKDGDSLICGEIESVGEAGIEVRNSEGEDRTFAWDEVDDLEGAACP